MCLLEGFGKSQPRKLHRSGGREDQANSLAVASGVLADPAASRAKEEPAARTLWQVDALGPADGAGGHARHLAAHLEQSQLGVESLVAVIGRARLERGRLHPAAAFSSDAVQRRCSTRSGR